MQYVCSAAKDLHSLKRQLIGGCYSLSIWLLWGEPLESGLMCNHFGILNCIDFSLYKWNHRSSFYVFLSATIVQSHGGPSALEIVIYKNKKSNDYLIITFANVSKNKAKRSQPIIFSTKIIYSLYPGNIRCEDGLL